MEILPTSIPSDYISALSSSFLFIIATSLFWIYLRFKPSEFPKEIPGPPRLPFLGILKTIMDNFENWPDENARLSSKYDQTWGGPLPNTTGLGGGVVYLADPICVYLILGRRIPEMLKYHSRIFKLLHV